MIELAFLRPVQRWLGLGWKMTWTSQRDSYPAIEYRCPACHKEDAWVSGINGFAGVAPVPHCCADFIPFPMNDESCVVHLNAKPRFSDGKTPAQRYVDMDEGGSTGETGYIRANPAVMFR